jgi:hypothetical protein
VPPVSFCPLKTHDPGPQPIIHWIETERTVYLFRGGACHCLGARCVFRNDLDSLASAVPPSELMRWRAVVRVLRSPLDAASCIHPSFLLAALLRPISVFPSHHSDPACPGLSPRPSPSAPRSLDHRLCRGPGGPLGAARPRSRPPDAVGLPTGTRLFSRAAMNAENQPSFLTGGKGCRWAKQ